MTSEQLNLVTAITSTAGLLLVIIGWIVASRTTSNQVKKQAKIATDYEIYKNVLNQVNDIIGKISTFISGTETHTSKMADILNEIHAQDSLPPKRQDELVDMWRTETELLVRSGYDIEESIMMFMRALDMSGTNFHSDTRVFKALHTVQNDASEAIRSIVRKWSNLDLVGTTVLQYEDLKTDTQRDIIRVDELGECIEDVLKLVFNDIMSENIEKKPKSIDRTEKRKMITNEGLVDNRFSGSAETLNT